MNVPPLELAPAEESSGNDDRDRDDVSGARCVRDATLALAMAMSANAFVWSDAENCLASS